MPSGANLGNLALRPLPIYGMEDLVSSSRQIFKQFALPWIKVDAIRLSPPNQSARLVKGRPDLTFSGFVGRA